MQASSSPFLYNKYALTTEQVEKIFKQYELNPSQNLYTKESLATQDLKKKLAVQHLILKATAMIDRRFRSLVGQPLDQEIDKYLHLAENITQKFLKRMQRFFPEFEINIQTLTDLIPCIERAYRYMEAKTSSPKENHHLIQRIASCRYLNMPEEDEQNQRPVFFETPFLKIYGRTHYGGLGSKYREINEDSLFIGEVLQNHTVFAGVIDGSGSSTDGYLAGKILNETFCEGFEKGLPFSKNFENAENCITDRLHGAYATGVVMMIDDRFVQLGSKGDTKALTYRKSKDTLLGLRSHFGEGGQRASTFLHEGCTQIHSLVAKGIGGGHLPPHAIHTSSKKHIITSSFGTPSLAYHTTFTAERGDHILLMSDGVSDIVSNYEILNFCQNFSGKDLENKIFGLAYQRNNSTEPFEIEFRETEKHTLPPLNAKKKSGDNLTLLVIEII